MPATNTKGLTPAQPDLPSPQPTEEKLFREWLKQSAISTIDHVVMCLKPRFPGLDVENAAWDVVVAVLARHPDKVLERPFWYFYGSTVNNLLKEVKRRIVELDEYSLEELEDRPDEEKWTEWAREELEKALGRFPADVRRDIRRVLSDEPTERVAEESQGRISGRTLRRYKEQFLLELRKLGFDDE